MTFYQRWVLKKLIKKAKKEKEKMGDKSLSDNEIKNRKALAINMIIGHTSMDEGTDPDALVNFVEVIDEETGEEITRKDLESKSIDELIELTEFMLKEMDFKV